MHKQHRMMVTVRITVIAHPLSAPLWDEPVARDAQIWPVSARGSHSFTCHPLTNHVCLYSPAADHHRPLAVWLVLTAPTCGRMARLSWPGWLVMQWDRFSRTGSWTPDTLTYPSTNRARRRVTSLIETNALTLSQTTKMMMTMMMITSRW